MAAATASTTTSIEARQPRMGLTRGKAARQIPTLDCTRAMISNQHKSLAQLCGKSMRNRGPSCWSNTTSTTAGGVCNNNTSKINMVISSPVNSRNANIPEEAKNNIMEMTSSRLGEDFFVHSPEKKMHPHMSPASKNSSPPSKESAYFTRSQQQSSSARTVSDGFAPKRRSTSFTMDEMSLDVLCMQVSELLGGPPIPKASVVPPTLAPTIEGSMGFHVLEGDNPSNPPRSSHLDMSSVNLEMQLEEMRRIEASQQANNERGQQASQKDVKVKDLPKDDEDEDEALLRRALAESACPCRVGVPLPSLPKSTLHGR